MARWYSKQRKSRINGDFLKYGFIPGRGRIALAQKHHRFAQGLALCEFTGATVLPTGESRRQSPELEEKHEQPNRKI